MSRSIACPKCHADVRTSPDRETGPFTCRKCQHTWTAVAKAEPTSKKAVRVLDAEEMTAAPTESDDRSKKKARKTKTPETLSPLVLVGFVAAGVTVVGVFAVVAWLVMRPATPNFPTAATSSPTTPGPVTPTTSPTTAEPLPRYADSPLYQKTVTGAALVLIPDLTGRDGVYIGAGSGTLVHRQRRLLLTTCRVCQANDRVLVFFPERKGNDELISPLKHYLDNAKTLGVPGKVVFRNPTADLALVELERVPATADEVRAAATPAATGSEVFSIGASGLNLATGSGLLWQISTGTVRRRFKNPVNFADGQSLHAMLIESTRQLANGDSGGPTVNAAGELVGLAFVNPSARDAFLLDLDLTELLDFLRGYATRSGWTWGGGTATTASTGKLDPLADAVERGTAEQRVAALRELATLGPDARKVVPKLIPRLDDPNPLVREVTVTALQKIGDPLADDLWCLGKALTATGPNARLHALRAFGTTQRVPAEHLPRVTALLEAESAEVQALAAGALGNYGPDCKGVALQPLAVAAGDANPAVGEAAVAALARMAPYRGDDFRWLTDRTTNPNARLRRFAVGQIGADAETVESAARHLAPALSDTDPKVRAAAVGGFAKWGKSALPLITSDALLKLLDDPDPTTRAAAVRTAGAVEAQPAMPKLLAAMKDATPEVRAGAAEAVANLDLTDPTHGNTAIDRLLDCDTAAALAKTFDKLAAATAVTKERVPKVAKALKRPEPAVRLAALTALASAGPTAAGHADAVSGLIRDDDPKQAEQAIDTLVKFGRAGAEPLAKRLDQTATDTLKGQIVQAIGRYGADTPAVAVVYLIAEAEKNPQVRAKVADAVAAVNTDDTVGQLRPLVSWSLDAKKKRTSKHPVDLQIWAFQTMARLDPNKLSEAERKKLLDGLKSQSDVDPDATCRREASAALAKLKAKVKTK